MHTRYDSDEAQWEAVVAKDPRADGHFVFSVSTTGVYCRPSCASRPALRKNLRFHATPGAAEAAGFRPCKRCRPGIGEPTLAASHAAAVSKACRLIETSESAPSLALLARHVGISPHHFHRLFKSVTGLTPKAYAAARRGRSVRKELTKSTTVTEAIHAAGFGSGSRFYERAAETLGMRPAAFRDGGTGETIRFATAPCTLGTVLVAASEKGICAITLGDASAPLVRDLRETFSKAQVIEADPAFGKTVAQIVRAIDTKEERFDLPLDIRGTAFQQRVWQALLRIPSGKTATYAEVAAMLGAPKAVRAVAGACAANRIAVVIPCHRVVRSDGLLAGYRWKSERKKALLEKESRAKR